MLSSFARLSLLERLLIWVLVACLVSLVGYMVVFVPVRDDLQRARNELEGAEAIRSNVTAEIEKDRAFAESLTREEQAVADEVAATPGADGPTDDPLFLLPELARLSGVQIERWRPLPDEPVAVWGVRRPVKVEARATWASFLELLRRVAELRETVAIDEMSLARPASAGEDAPMEISFRASVVWVRSDLATLASRDPDGKATL